MLLKWVILLFAIQAAVHVNCAPRKKEIIVEEPVKKRHNEVVAVEKEEVEPKEWGKDEVVLKKHPIKVHEVVKLKEQKPKKKRIVEEKGVELKKEKIKVERVSESKEEEKKFVEKKKHSSKREEKEVVEVEKKVRPKKIEEVKEVIVEKKEDDKEKEIYEKKVLPKKKEKVIIEEKEEPKKEVVVEKKKKLKVYKSDLEEFEDAKPYQRKVKPYKELGAYKEGRPYDHKAEEFKGAEEYVSNLQYANKMTPYKGAAPYKGELTYDSKTLPYEGLKGYSGGLAYESRLQGYKGTLGYKGGMHYEDKLDSYKQAQPYYSKVEGFHTKPHFKKEEGEMVPEWGKDKYDDFESKVKKPFAEFNYYEDKRGDIFGKGKESSLFKSDYGFGAKETISAGDLYADPKEKEYGFGGRDWGSKYKSYDIYDKSLGSEYEKKGEGLKYGGYDKLYSTEIGGKGFEQKGVGLHYGMSYNEKPMEIGPKYSDFSLGPDLHSRYGKEIGPKYDTKIGGDTIRGGDLGRTYENTGFRFRENLGNKYNQEIGPKYTPEIGNKYNNEVNPKYTEEVNVQREGLTHGNIGKYVTYEKKVPKTIVIEEKSEKVPVVVKKER